MFTILLRGYCQVGDVQRARSLLDEMTLEGLRPDARAVNTFLRGCLHRGDVLSAQEVFQKMQSEWQIVPDATCQRCMAQLLSQGLRLKDLKLLMCLGQADLVLVGFRKRPNTSAASTGKRHKRDPCTFWAAGKCSKA